jgi:hypothetical protein
VNLKFFVYLKDNFYIRVDNMNRIEVFGNINISFDVVYDIFNIYLNSICNNIQFEMPDITKMEYEKFIITDKKTSNKYIMCNNGSVSVNLINNLTIINYSYYIELLNNYLVLFKNLSIM